MIVQRFRNTVKVGCREEFVDLFKGWVEHNGVTGRVTTFKFGDQDTVSLDIEFETEEDRVKFWAEFDWSEPGNAQVLSKANDLRKSLTVELLRVH